MLNPKQQGQTSESQQFETPESDHNHESWETEQADDDKSEMLYEMWLDGSQTLTWGKGIFEIAIELVTLLLVLVEEEGLEENRSHNEEFPNKSN